MKNGIFTDENAGLNLQVNIGELAAGSLLKGQVILITGGSRGIGFCLAEKCIRQGAKVIITGKNRERLETAGKTLGENGAVICADIADISGYDSLLQKAETFFGPVCSIVNNAGISLHEGCFENVTEETWDAQMAVDLKAPYFFTQAWLRYYRERNLRSGRILMMASDTSGMGSSIPYGLAKAGIASLTHGLAKKLITEGIRINAVAPGTTLTDMTDDFVQGRICRETTAGKRVLFPGEVAELCVFLLSDLSACVSGNIFGCSEANICFDNVQRENETNP